MVQNVVYSQRKRIQETETREASGGSLWTDEFDDRVRRRLAEIYAIIKRVQRRKQGFEVAKQAASVMRFRGGWAMGDYLENAQLVNDGRGTDWLLDALDSIYESLGDGHEGFQTAVNQILSEHRISFRMVEGQMVSFESDELLQTVVEPALRLLVGTKFEKAHAAYLAALKEDDPSDAITDAGTALQETLVALGCSGNALGPLIKDAKKNGLFAGHDQTLLDGIAKFMD